MRILLINDDGITAPGLQELGTALADAGHSVSVCAPDRERSAASHSITLASSLHPRALQLCWAEHAWALDGTPADCACIGLFLMRREPVDLVISGINRGMNLGGACVYSGTVAGALEASMRGTQALATSLCVPPIPGTEADYGPAVRVTLRVAEWALSHPLPRGVMYNLNVPPLPWEEIRGIAPARLTPVFLEQPDFTITPDGSYRYHGKPGIFDREDYDLVKMEAGWATLTKLTWDFRQNAPDGELGEIEL